MFLFDICCLRICRLRPVKAPLAPRSNGSVLSLAMTLVNFAQLLLPRSRVVAGAIESAGLNCKVVKTHLYLSISFRRKSL